MLLDSVNGKFEDQWFNAPTNSLTILGGSGTDDDHARIAGAEFSMRR